MYRDGKMERRNPSSQGKIFSITFVFLKIFFVLAVPVQENQEDRVFEFEIVIIIDFSGREHQL